MATYDPDNEWYVRELDPELTGEADTWLQPEHDYYFGVEEIPPMPEATNRTVRVSILSGASLVRSFTVDEALLTEVVNIVAYAKNPQSAIKAIWVNGLAAGNGRIILDDGIQLLAKVFDIDVNTRVPQELMNWHFFIRRLVDNFGGNTLGMSDEIITNTIDQFITFCNDFSKNIRARNNRNGFRPFSAIDTPN